MQQAGNGDVNTLFLAKISTAAPLQRSHLHVSSREYSKSVYMLVELAILARAIMNRRYHRLLLCGDILPLRETPQRLC